MSGMLSYNGGPVDIFAIGCILYALDMQDLPFPNQEKIQPEVTEELYLDVFEKYLEKRE
jgi:hypothetical protein